MRSIASSQDVIIIFILWSLVSSFSLLTTVKDPWSKYTYSCNFWLLPKLETKRRNVERSSEKKGTNSLLSTRRLLHTSGILRPPFPGWLAFSVLAERLCWCCSGRWMLPSQGDVGHASSTDIYTFPPLHLTLQKESSHPVSMQIFSHVRIFNSLA